MEHIYVIETKCKHTIRWRFEEIQHKSEYGNGKYVIVVNLDTHELIGYIDVRYYINFNFTTFCEEYIKEYFGNNLNKHFTEE